MTELAGSVAYVYPAYVFGANFIAMEYPLFLGRKLLFPTHSRSAYAPLFALTWRETPNIFFNET